MTNKRPAYSLIFAFVIMTLIMAIASTSIQDTRQKLQLFRELESSSQARLAGVSAAELGIVALKDSDFTAETETDGFCLEEDGRSDCRSEGSYTVYPYMSENTDASDGYYYLPTPGTGNAAPTDDCSILDDDKDVDHACNWNKLAVGDSVTIPMYYDDGSGNLSIPMSGTGFSSWHLKLRTPCENGNLSDDCDDASSGTAGDRYRFDHNDSASDDSDGDDMLNDENRTIVYWDIAGYDASGTSVLSAIPDDCILFNTSVFKFIRDACSSNTEIHEVMINDESDAGTYTVLDTSSSSALHTDLSYSSVETMYLTLSIINDLTEEDGSNIPYLEYQFVLDSTTPFIGAKSSIIGEGYFESNNYTYYFPYVISYSSITEVTNLYTLSN